MCAADYNTFQLNSNSNSNRLTLPKLTATVGKELRVYFIKTSVIF